MASSQLLLPMKRFVKSSDSTLTTTLIKDKPKKSSRAAFVSGTNEKQFYEMTVGKEALETRKIELKEGTILEQAKPNKKVLKIPFNVNLLMKAVENGNAKDVKDMLEANEEGVNCQDQFGWTPLMSACCAGNGPMVQLLLQWKPDLSVRDKRGNTCRDLAVARSHKTILDILKTHIRDKYKPPVSNHYSAVTNQSDSSIFYCKVCKQNIENASIKKHLSSTVHNFHTASKRKMPTMYGIPESNKGFQIMVKSGWDKEGGLGPTGEGHKFPPKTTLKQDRTGLGAKKYQARVTHTMEDARKEVKPKNTFKRNLNSEKRKERRRERNLRQILS